MKKNKKKTPKVQKKQYSFKIFCAVIMLMVVVLAASVSWRNHRDKVRKENIATVRNTLDAYQRTSASLRREVWWMERAPALPTQESVSVLLARKHMIEAIVAKHKSVSPLTRKIAERFTELRTTVFINGRPHDVVMNGITNKVTAREVNICFLPKEIAKPGHFLLPIWNTDLDMMVVPAMEVPDKVLAAIVFHELGHGLRHNKYDGRPADPDGTPAYMLEEAEMHELGGEILDAETHGEYRTLIHSILGRSGRSRDFVDVLTKITQDDYLTCDRMFGCMTAEMPSFLVETQLLIDCALSWCKRHGRYSAEDKILVYKWFCNNIFTGSP